MKKYQNDQIDLKNFNSNQADHANFNQANCNQINKSKIEELKSQIKKASNGNERLRLNVVYLHYKDYNITQDILCISYCSKLPGRIS